VTGGAGYVGSVLCEHLLDAGFAVTVLDDLSVTERTLFHLVENPRFDFVFGDARNRDLLREEIAKADVIIPLAAVVGAPACDEKPELARALNVEAIRAIDELRSPDQLVVYPNTNSGYGAQSGEVYCTEETPLEPITLYGRTKCEAEDILLSSKQAITLRLATLFGFSPRLRLDLMVNHFVYTALNDGAIILFEKDFKRNFLHVRDAADCFVHCIQNASAMAGRPYNVGRDAENLSKWELALKIKEHLPNFYVHAAEIGSDPDKRNYIVSNQRLREAGFEAERSLDDGIRELIKGYRMLRGGPLRNV